jgi:hypothetical protein
MKTLIKIPIPSLLIALILALTSITGLLPKAEAVSPAPDGGYPGGNTAEGQAALLSLTTGGFNTAVGFLSLRSNTTNSFNTAIGAGTLLANTADQNTATGAGALLSNTTANFNTANGAFALVSNTTGAFNTAMGHAALFSNTQGGENMAIGESALLVNTTGQKNVAIGVSALRNSNGANNVVIGHSAGLNITTANDVICVGSFVSGANVGGTCFIGSIRGVQTQNADAIPVLIDSAGQLGTTSSSRRFKHEIKPMDQASEAILGLKPVTFQYKSDKTSTPQFGLIAEEVARVNPDLVVRDKNGEIYTVRYDAVNAMLLNEFLKEHQTVQELKSAAVKQDAMIGQQQKQIDALTTGLQKVSAQLEVSKPAPQTVLNNR